MTILQVFLCASSVCVGEFAVRLSRMGTFSTAHILNRYLINVKTGGKIMRIKSLLFGVNAKCGQCTGSCKQFKQVVVVYCPNFKSIMSDCKKTLPFVRGKGPEMPPERRSLKTDTMGIVINKNSTFKHKKERKK